MKFKNLGYALFTSVFILFSSCTSDTSSNNNKDITAFSFPEGTGVITDVTSTEGTIAVTVPYSTDVTALVATFTTTGQSVFVGAEVTQVSGITINDFTNPVHYIVTALNGTTKDYTVTVTKAEEPSSETKILTFTIPNQTVTTAIDNIAHTLFVQMPVGTSSLLLTPTITVSPAASISPLSGVVQNFASPVTYTVTAEDGTTTQDWVVTVSVPETFTIEGVPFNMMYVPGGLTFPTGITNDSTATVTNAYWTGETEITYELWSTVYTWALANGYHFDAGTGEGTKGSDGTGSDQQPVTFINWRAAMVFSNALTELYNATNGTDPDYGFVYKTIAGPPIRDARGSNGTQCEAVIPDYNQDGFRLLTSNEWELAARYKGSDSTNGAIEYPTLSGLYWTPGSYASGAAADYNNTTAIEAVAWCSANSSGTTQIAKLLGANALGLYDMSGNVNEWNFDCSPIGPSNCTSNFSFRIMRGGDYSTANLTYIQLGLLNNYEAGETDYIIGSRLSRTNRSTPTTLSIGDPYQGGIIAYILLPGDPNYDANVQHGIIAAISDQSEGIMWWIDEPNPFDTPLGTALGTGSNNTSLIMSSGHAAGTATALCDSLVLNGYSDWYLPSKDELNKLYTNKLIIGGFANSDYWTSSNIDEPSVWEESFITGGYTADGKDDNLQVRCTRSF